MKRIDAKALCRMAILAALYFLLTLFSIRAGSLKISLSSLPVVVAALLGGPLQAAAVALVGELLSQMLSYGFTATTVLWLIPGMLRGLVIGLAAAQSWRRAERTLDSRPLACYGICVVAALITTVSNTAVIWLDSVLYHYYTFAYVFGSLLLRLFTGVLTALVVTTLAIPLVQFLRRLRLDTTSRQ